MKRNFQALTVLVLAVALAACGGGGGSPGATPSTPLASTTAAGATGVDTTSTTGDTQATSAGSISLQVKNAASADTSSIGGTEQAKAVAKVIGPTGAPLGGVIVVFSQADANLLTIAPASGTALTDATGTASVDIKAANSSQTGAVSVVAQVLVGTTSLSAKKALQITAATTAAEVPRSMLFLDASPSSIVLKGAGGQGRSESATLRFKVVNSSNTPIQGAVVNFTINQPSVTLNITQAVSDAEGVVVTTVTAGTQATSVVVTATAAANSAATVPSSSLSVSNGLTIAGGFEVVAEKYNIDGGVTGSTTKISAFMRDINGNLVPDGTVASFTTDFGAVGSSSAGSCSSLNGACSVDFRVQEPRGAGLATVTGTLQLPGNSAPLSDSVQINMAKSAGSRALSALPGTVATTLTLPAGSCKDTFTLYAADANNHPQAAGGTITALAAGKSVKVAVESGSPVADSLSGQPTTFRLTIDATAAAPLCVPGGTVQQDTSFELQFTSPGNIISTVPMVIKYPS
jgi:hypothetical protein